MDAAAEDLPRWLVASSEKLKNQDEDMLAATLPAISPSEDKFPFCLVWGPLPVIGWLVPFAGHIGICRSDGTVLDFAGSYFVNVGRMAFGSPIKYIRLAPSKACLAVHLGDHRCQAPHAHEEYGCNASWDDALGEVIRQFQHEQYNIFTCNCHSFVTCCMNRLGYGGKLDRTILHMGWMILAHGNWVDRWGPVKAYAPFVVVMALGIFVSGWAFIACWGVFAGILLLWYISGTLFFKGVIKNK